MAQSELCVLATQYLDRRIPDKLTLTGEVAIRTVRRTAALRQPERRR